jgi:uncharacterized protein YjbI with pentapeptide repeats
MNLNLKVKISFSSTFTAKPETYRKSMQKDYITDQKFEKEDYAVTKFEKADYEGCYFLNCNFSNVDLSDVNFTDCEFIDCNLSSAKIIQTTFGDVQFKDCKMLGLHFENCNEFIFSAKFDNCILNLCSFYKRKMKKTNFAGCSLHEVDFTEADLSESGFDKCDLKDAKFENTMLEKADLRTAFNYSIDPELNKIKKGKFSFPSVAGLLHKYDISISAS